MVGHGGLVIVRRRPVGDDGGVHVREDLGGALVLPLGGGRRRAVSGHRGLSGIRVVEDAGGAVAGNTHVDVLVLVPVVGQAHTVGQQIVQGTSDVVGLLHVHEHDPQGYLEHMGLVNAVVHVCADDGDAVGPAGAHRTVPAAAGDAVAHGLGGDGVHPAAAGIDVDVPGIRNAGEGLADQRVPLLQLGAEKCPAGGNARFPGVARRIVYCYLAACPAPGHDSHVIAPYILLPVPVPLRNVAAMVAAGHLPQHTIAHVADEGCVLQMEVRDQAFPPAAHVLDVPLGVGGVVFRPHVLCRVAAGDLLSLEAGYGGGIEDVLRVAADLHQTVRVAVQSQLTRPVVHFPRAGDGHVVAD